ncbi:MAG TPA: TetR/AcrR family transcriptional regulator C-terminal domain-containing protein [Actinomycetes bacterium]|nr:TetR/AcrR family transcriptional regulator C-terminal domain-containing protein [Actinomycetes bacterium]
MSRCNIGPGMTRYLDAALGRLREGGFSVEETQQVSADVLGQLPAHEYPHVVEVITEIMRSGREEDFEFGLDLILDGLQRTLDQG